MSKLKRPLAVLALGALAACANPSNGAPIVSASPRPIVTPASGVPLVGIGDSLTAGYQSDGFLGATTATSSLSAYPGGAVPPGQENGWWALMYQSITGASTASLYNPATSPLPLIAAPGMGTQLVLNATSLFAAVQSSCSTFNDAGFSSTAWATTRMDPADQNYDLGIPGVTMHEGVAMAGPITGPPPSGTNCGYKVLPNDPTSGALQSLVSGESGVFYPVMGSYIHNVSSLTELNVAVALKPKLTTVWLGANDVLKFSFAGGNPIASDSPTQMATDVTTIVKSLTAVGSKVLVADLPNVLEAPQFFPAGNRLIADITQLLVVASKGAITPTVASGLATQINTYIGTQYGVTTGGYLTESGFLAIINNCATNISTCTTPQLDPDGTGSGLGGDYLTPALAQEVQTLNTEYNHAIDTVATTSGSNVALVPITATFSALAPNATTPGSAPNLDTVIPGAPSAYFSFGGGLVSWDGLHPSNLGYAVIANTFIQTADTAFGMTLAPLSNTQLATIAASDPYSPTLVNTAFGGTVFPLP